MTAAMDTTTHPCGRFEWERVVRRVIMPARVKLLALVLASYADPDGTRVRPGVDVLAAVTGSSERSVRRGMQTLRDEYGLLAQITRGGGRGGRGRAAAHRLTVPVDLLDRVELLPPDEDRRRDSPVKAVAAQPDESPATQVTAQTDVNPVDNSESPATIVTGQSGDTAENDRPHGSTSQRLTGQKSRLTGHPGGRLPPTGPPTQRDHPSSHLPTEPQTAHADDTSQNDHAESEEPPPPPKCVHGLVAHTRPDGSPKCPLCRRVGEADP